MKYWATILLLLTGAAHAEDCKHRILFLPQTHASIMGEQLQVTPEWFNATVQSQFKIATYLKQHKDLSVFSEQVSSETTMKTVSPDFLEVTKQIRSIFPNGLPVNFQTLTDQQKTIFAKAGGDAMTFMFGDIQEIHKVVESDQVEDELIGKVTTWVKQHPYATEYPPEISNIIFNIREGLALDQINQFFAKHPEQRDAILIFGNLHDFRTHPDKFPPQCVLTPFEFQSDVKASSPLPVEVPNATR